MKYTNLCNVKIIATVAYCIKINKILNVYKRTFVLLKKAKRAETVRQFKRDCNIYVKKLQRNEIKGSQHQFILAEGKLDISFR